MHISKSLACAYVLALLISPRHTRTHFHTYMQLFFFSGVCFFFIFAFVSMGICFFYFLFFLGFFFICFFFPPNPGGFVLCRSCPWRYEIYRFRYTSNCHPPSPVCLCVCARAYTTCMCTYVLSAAEQVTHYVYIHAADVNVCVCARACMCTYVLSNAEQVDSDLMCVLMYPYLMCVLMYPYTCVLPLYLCPDMCVLICCQMSGGQ